MNEPLTPLLDYIKANPIEEWESRKEMVVYKSGNRRFRIIEEVPSNLIDSFRDMARNSALAEKGVWSCEFDAKDFAQQLMDTFFMHISPYQMRYISDALESYLKEWEGRTGQKIRDET